MLRIIKLLHFDLGCEFLGVMDRRFNRIGVLCGIRALIWVGEVWGFWWVRGSAKCGIFCLVAEKGGDSFFSAFLLPKLFWKIRWDQWSVDRAFSV